MQSPIYTTYTFTAKLWVSTASFKTFTMNKILFIWFFLDIIECTDHHHNIWLPTFTSICLYHQIYFSSVNWYIHVTCIRRDRTFIRANLDLQTHPRTYINMHLHTHTQTHTHTHVFMRAHTQFPPGWILS
jgi:hypothetical protein